MNPGGVSAVCNTLSGKNVLARVTGAVSVTAVGVGTVFTVPSILGFSSSGVVANSVAAMWQSSIGNVAAHSTFSAMQWYGATTPLTSTFGPVIFMAGMSAVLYRNVGATRFFEKYKSRHVSLGNTNTCL